MTEGKYLLLMNIKDSKKVLGPILGRGHCVLRFHALPVSVCSLCLPPKTCMRLS